MAKLLAVCSLLAAHAAASAAPGAAQLARGKYLMEGIAACANCHGARDASGRILAERGMSGGRLFDFPEFKSYASNITPDPQTGIGKWTDAQLGKAIREGVRPDGSIIGPPMPIEFYRNISDDDLAAMIAYLRAQPSVANSVPKSRYVIALPPSYGPPLSVVKAPPPSDRKRYGEYLANVGHCMECHTPQGAGGRLDEKRLGAGGRAFDGPWGTSVSRNLTPHASGLKNWSDAQISTAVRQGKNRSGAPYMPPMAFDWYRTISDADMASLTTYLRSLAPVPSVAKP
jgi:mono/diheme cytochrome c family protein